MFHDLFWALYWIDVLGSFTATVTMGLFLGVVGGAATALIGAVVLHDDEYSRKPHDQRVSFAEAMKSTKGWGFRVLWASLFIALVIVLVPSKKTMYMMLAVRGGEQVVNSEIGQKLSRLINEQIDEYIGVLEQKKK